MVFGEAGGRSHKDYLADAVSYLWTYTRIELLAQLHIVQN